MRSKIDGVYSDGVVLSSTSSVRLLKMSNTYFDLIHCRDISIDPSIASLFCALHQHNSIDRDQRVEIFKILMPINENLPIDFKLVFAFR